VQLPQRTNGLGDLDTSALSFVNLAQILKQSDGLVIGPRALRDDKRLDLLPGGGLALRQGAQMTVTSRGLLALTTQALLGFSREEDLSPLFREYSARARNAPAVRRGRVAACAGACFRKRRMSSAPTVPSPRATRESSATRSSASSSATHLSISLAGGIAGAFDAPSIAALPFGLTLEDLPRGISRLRNRVIGRTFHALGLIEQWGSGIQRMTTACRDVGLAPPTLEEVGNRFRVTLWLEQVGATTLDKTEQAILAMLKDGTGRVTSQVAKVIGLTPRATRTRLVRPVERGLVREVGTSPQDPKRRYFISS